MSTSFETIKTYIAALPLMVDHEDPEEQMLVVSAEQQGIHRLVIDCEDDILVIEQFLLDLPSASKDNYRDLLKINRELIHGALCLDESGTRLIFRDTLALANLDLNELEGSVNALSLMLAEHADELIQLSQQGGATA
ncbi:YbjN domain-containing protein [Marinobacter sp. HN1S83]|uniref:YbjN domain-containing protein n=1 Tax=Marinobacter sp. HN1S83 TaxID=3382301 RepID=UPI00387ABB51